MKMLQKKIDCESLINSQKNVYRRNNFSKVASLQSTDSKQTSSQILSRICDALRDLVPFVQFKKREKHPWGSVNFNKVAGFSLQLY